jgi:hypothetical protein
LWHGCGWWCVLLTSCLMAAINVKNELALYKRSDLVLRSADFCFKGTAH